VIQTAINVRYGLFSPGVRQLEDDDDQGQDGSGYGEGEEEVRHG
jgi:hypothetical protein